ncbi:MAG: hypothetical protein H6981_03215 [Gammaproteobacteria bacterium]|nr:hypothetical protein [Gammaproteobacteria bacterium]MCP5135799.1 hypothetical protein [Gammaproteobacteria bacterium]
MSPRTLSLLAASCGVLLSAGAQAFTIDYLTLANSNERGYSAYTTSNGGVTVTATGTSIGDTNSTPDYYAYLDSGNAGLGVCKTVTSGMQCSPSSDDNVTFGEALNLTFSQAVTLDQLRFRNADHGTTFASNADISISIDGGVFTDFSLVHLFNTPLTGTSFTFIGDSTHDGDQFYISSVGGSVYTPPPSTGVPIPGSLWLLTGSLVALRRRFVPQA